MTIHKIFMTLAGLSLIAGLTGCPAQETEQTRTTSEATSSPSAATPLALVGKPENGAKVFMAKTCQTCHIISSVKGAVGNIGPKLDGVATRAATRVTGLDAAAYLRQSIENPTAYVVEKYQPLMPSLRTTMSDQEFSDLIAFLLTLKT
jgi:cytochrome c2